MEAFDVFMFVVLLRFSTTASGDNTAAPDEITVIPLVFDTPQNVSDKEKAALRYGFHRIQECNSFEKSFICIRKCLDLDFDVAYSDKFCICTCFKNREKAKYKIPQAGPTKWRLGAPTTQLPPWPTPAEAKLAAVGSDFSSEIKHDEDSAEAKQISDENDPSIQAGAVTSDEQKNNTLNSSNESGVTQKGDSSDLGQISTGLNDTTVMDPVNGNTPGDLVTNDSTHL